MAGTVNVGTLSGRVEFEDKTTATLDLILGKIEKLEEGFNAAGGTVAKTAAGFITAEAAMGIFNKALEVGVQWLKDITIEGAGVADVEENFENLAVQAGRLSSTLLNELRAGTHGTITDLELMKTINQDLAAGLNLTDEQFRTLADGAFALAQATGEDVAVAFDKMNNAMLTGRTRSLEMLTGKINLAEAEEKYAKTLGTTVERLTEEEKLEAKRLAILDNVAGAVQRLGEQTDGLDELLAQAATEWENFQNNLGKTIATSPVLMTAFMEIKAAIIDAFGGTQQEAIRRITNLVNEGAIAAVEFAALVVDSVGIAGSTWESFKMILTSVKVGWAAIAYSAEGALLVMMKIANFATGGLVLDERVKVLAADMERWYQVMAEGVVDIENNKKAQDAWAVSTGEVREKIEGVRQKMIAANEQHKAAQAELAASTTATMSASDAALVFAASQGKVSSAIRHTAEEAKLYKEAIKEMALADKAHMEGISMTQLLLRGINDEVERAVKRYLDAGVSLDKLRVAYNLTNAEAKAIQDTWTQESKVLQETIKAQKELADMSKPLETALVGVSAKVEDQAREMLKAGASADTVKKAYQLTDLQLRAIQQTLKDGQEAWKQEQKDLQVQTQMVRTLAGEWISAAEAKERMNTGGSYTVNRSNLAASAKAFGIPESLAFQLAELGFSFQEIRDAWLSKSWDKWKPSGPRIQGFREGGWGDFGDGTLAMLHGKEAIVPMNRMPAGFGNVTNYFYINGTAEDVARKIKEVIMNDLRAGRSFGLNR